MGPLFKNQENWKLVVYWKYFKQGLIFDSITNRPLQMISGSGLPRRLNRSAVQSHHRLHESQRHTQQASL